MTDHRPVASYFHDACPTDEQVRAAVAAALDDQRVMQAIKLFMGTFHNVPLSTVLAAVFCTWDALDPPAKIGAMAEMCGWDMEWLTADSLLNNVAAWRCPWDDFKEAGGQ